MSVAAPTTRSPRRPRLTGKRVEGLRSLRASLWAEAECKRSTASRTALAYIDSLCDWHDRKRKGGQS